MIFCHRLSFLAGARFTKDWCCETARGLFGLPPWLRLRFSLLRLSLLRFSPFRLRLRLRLLLRLRFGLCSCVPLDMVVFPG